MRDYYTGLAGLYGIIHHARLAHAHCALANTLCFTSRLVRQLARAAHDHCTTHTLNVAFNVIFRYCKERH